MYGILFVMPIGGADMPVVISLLNSLTGIAAAMAGFIYHNLAMILGGILVGAAGSILTLLMCKAMNRSLWNVLLGGFGGGGVASGEEGGTIKEITLSDASIFYWLIRKKWSSFPDTVWLLRRPSIMHMNWKSCWKVKGSRLNMVYIP
ncbi:MAG: NAD(P)(+) transhydrogenase (Re/Si-specific) subunit beta [Bacteroidales bacterium]